MRYITVPVVTVLTLICSLSHCQAATKLLWRTAAGGVTIAPNAAATLVTLGQVDVSAYDRLRVVAVARRPTGVPLTSGFGAPVRIELRIREGSDDLGLLESGILLLNPTSTGGDAPARTERATTLYDFPVITSLLVGAVGPTSGSQRTTIDVYVYGQTDSPAAGQ